MEAEQQARRKMESALRGKALAEGVFGEVMKMKQKADRIVGEATELHQVTCHLLGVRVM
jgi:hypothetical protein